ncbi:hypothetical protein RFI_39049 [Reticulomyxa filosa]|uniref:Transmembrane protein n=1 Tax=Reticulomyxa filosa TaxID=46433 RepID=X6LCK4_RETFI|nr:hypothetical protein RFI_39049 [Reticulomyxa filosa]|eukprot:ETN98449.1 hypothetical protein RFI_39049 [Reticulomyxa filosa]
MDTQTNSSMRKHLETKDIFNATTFEKQRQLLENRTKQNKKQINVLICHIIEEIVHTILPKYIYCGNIVFIFVLYALRCCDNNETRPTEISIDWKAGFVALFLFNNDLVIVQFVVNTKNNKQQLNLNCFERWKKITNVVLTSISFQRYYDNKMKYYHIQSFPSNIP